MNGWMTVTPTDDGGFEMKVDRGDGLSIKAVVELGDGRPRCHTLELHSSAASVDRDLLKTLSLATLLRRAAAHVPGARVPLERPGLSDAFLKQVATTYRQALKNHTSTAAAVAKLGIGRGEHVDEEAPPSTVGRWIAAAERRGYLEATTQGRKRRVSQRTRNPAGGRSVQGPLAGRPLPPYSKSAQ
jgi:hypothetical protein